MKRECLNPNCNQSAAARGLCQTCYQMARRLIAEGKTTWERLTENGRAQEIGYRQDGSRVTQWLLSNNEPKE